MTGTFTSTVLSKWLPAGVRVFPQSATCAPRYSPRFPFTRSYPIFEMRDLRQSSLRGLDSRYFRMSARSLPTFISRAVNVTLSALRKRNRSVPSSPATFGFVGSNLPQLSTICLSFFSLLFRCPGPNRLIFSRHISADLAYCLRLVKISERIERARSAEVRLPDFAISR